MFKELVQLSFDKIVQTRSYSLVVLGMSEKRFAIYTDPSVGQRIQAYLNGVTKPRPQTHDLLHMLFQGLGIRIKQVVITDLQDTIYFARLFLEQQRGDIKHIVEVDARPSDCITIALMSNVPIYCTSEVLEKTVALED
jgi:bifunctional DNase/RNase